MKTNGIPSTEIVWTTQKTLSGNTYYITSKKQRDMYFIYKRIDDKAVKIGKGKNPAELLDKYAV